METRETTETMGAMETESTETMESTDSTLTIGSTETMGGTDSTLTIGSTETMGGTETIKEIITQGPCYLVRYNPFTMPFFQWLNAFEYVADFLRIPDGVMGHFFLYMMDPITFASFHHFFSLFGFHILSYKRIVAMAVHTFGTFDEPTVAEFRFWNRSQLIGESPKQYINVLRKLISKCNSRVNTINNLKSRFIEGLILQWIKSVIKNRKHLTLDEAVDFAEHFENRESLARIDRLFKKNSPI